MMMNSELSKLKRVMPRDVRIGMYVHGFEGSWLSHPFWRSKFLVEDDDVLDRLHNARVPAIIIDEARAATAPAPGRTPRSPVPLSGDGASAPRRRTLATLQEQAVRPAIKVSPTADRDEAARVVEQSQLAMQDLFADARTDQPVSVKKAETVVRDVSTAVQRNRSIMLGITRLKTKDEYTYYHSVAVCALMIGVGRELNLDDRAVQELGMAGLLHDIGKAGIAEAILNKPGGLTDSEMAIIKQHPVRGYEMLMQAGGLPGTVLDVCRYHHERLDGSGYPFGLTGDALSRDVRIAGLCDMYDAMTSVRPYKNAVTPIDAVTELAAMGAEIDRSVLFALMRTVGAFPLGMLVRLRSDKLAVVLPRSSRSTKPRVRVVHCALTDMPVTPYDLVLLDRDDDDDIVREETPGEWRIDDWPAVIAGLTAR